MDDLVFREPLIVPFHCIDPSVVLKREQCILVFFFTAVEVSFDSPVRGLYFLKSGLLIYSPSAFSWNPFCIQNDIAVYSLNGETQWRHYKFRFFSMKKITRMHSSRMRTTRSSSRTGGLHQARQGPYPPEQTPPGADTPQEQASHQSRHPPEQAPPGTRHPHGTRHPPVDRHTPVNILPCPKLRLWAIMTGNPHKNTRKPLSHPGGEGVSDRNFLSFMFYGKFNKTVCGTPARVSGPASAKFWMRPYSRAEPFVYLYVAIPFCIIHVWGVVDISIVFHNGLHTVVIYRNLQVRSHWIPSESFNNSILFFL